MWSAYGGQDKVVINYYVYKVMKNTLFCNLYFKVCGGGPKMSLWHLRSMTATSVFDTPKVCQQTVQFYDDMV